MGSAPKIQKGDLVEAKSARSASVAGKVVSIGRSNVEIECDVRFSPTGPWFRQKHKVSTNDIVVVARGEQIIWKKD